MPKQGRREKDTDAPFSLDLGEAPGLRVQRLEHILFEELDRLFRLEVSDPVLYDVVPAKVQLSPDLRNAKVYYALRQGTPAGKGKGGEAAAARAVEEGLKRVTPFLRARIAEALIMKRLPDLHFHRDRLAESSLRASSLLASASHSSSSPRE